MPEVFFGCFFNFIAGIGEVKANFIACLIHLKLNDSFSDRRCEHGEILEDKGKWQQECHRTARS